MSFISKKFNSDASLNIHHPPPSFKNLFLDEYHKFCWKVCGGGTIHLLYILLIRDIQCNPLYSGSYIIYAFEILFSLGNAAESAITISLCESMSSITNKSSHRNKFCLRNCCSKHVLVMTSLC